MEKEPTEMTSLKSSFSPSHSMSKRVLDFAGQTEDIKEELKSCFSASQVSSGSESSTTTTDGSVAITMPAETMTMPINSSSRNNSVIWSGHDSRLLLFLSQISFCFIAVGFGMYLVIEHDHSDVYMNFGSSLIMYVLGFLTKNPVIKRKSRR